MDEATFRAALDPKVRGFAVLHDVLRSEPLDFLLALSSVNGVFGNPGQGNYAAGCAFKDAFARASADFCDSSRDYLVALDRYGDVLHATAPTVRSSRWGASPPAGAR